MLTIWLAVLASVLGMFTLPPSKAQAPPLAEDLARVLGRWDQLRQAAPVVKYVVRSEWFPPQIKPGDPKPGEDGAYTGTGVVLLDPAKGRLRVDKDELFHFTNAKYRLSRVRSTLRYDGREQWSAAAINNDAAIAPVVQRGTHAVKKT